jgi:lipid A 3-O-deacylase
VTTLKQLLVLLAAAPLLILGPRVMAGVEPAPAPPLTDIDPTFHRGALELQLIDGVEFSQQDTGPMRPNIDYEDTALRLGYMIDSAHRGGTFLRGNDELLLEGVDGVIFQGPGSGLGGLSILYRRNFLAPGARIVPYMDGGGGGVYCDAYHNQEQRALGSKGEFDLQGGVGVHFRLTQRISLDTEVAYRHLSNADLAPRNLGVNSIGGGFGVSFTF